MDVTISIIQEESFLSEQLLEDSAAAGVFNDCDSRTAPPSFSVAANSVGTEEKVAPPFGVLSCCNLATSEDCGNEECDDRNLATSEDCAIKEDDDCANKGEGCAINEEDCAIKEDGCGINK